MAQPVPPRLSEAEYLRLERASDVKHDFIDGNRVPVGGPNVAMAGGSFEHNRVALRVLAALESALAASPCFALPSDMKIKINPAGRYYYPDASVVCSPRFVDDESRDAILNPMVIVEVLSDSTERLDRGSKFQDYRLIPEFTDYLLCSSTEPRVEHFTRQPDDSWNLREYGPGESLILRGLPITLQLDDLYVKVFG